MRKKRVAFICVHNSCRSQIAEALGKYLAYDVFESYSVEIIQLVAFQGVDRFYNPSFEDNAAVSFDVASKLISDIPEPDIVISMGCNVGCPFIGRPFDDNWGLEDPTGCDDEAFKKVIKEIENNILKLKKQIGGDAPLE